MKNGFLLIFLVAVLAALLAILFLTDFSKPGSYKQQFSEKPIWQIRSIDTVKYSRDLAREKAKDPSFDSTIGQQVKNIKEAGANYIAISTPYDDEFKPYLNRWVNAARENSLKIWFRGNFSGWEKWFNYESIDRQTHLANTEKFILENPDLFEDGDIFTSCPECENGGPGDPRKNGDVGGFRKFLIDEYNVSKNAFAKINKGVKPGYFSMNYDVAKLIMDSSTSNSLGGISVIDHYVASPEKLSQDAKLLARSNGSMVVIGEFGAPVEDINGSMTEDEQANWIIKALEGLSNTPEVIGINYWVGVGGSTQIWDEKGNPTKAVDIIKKYYNLTRQIPQ